MQSFFTRVFIQYGSSKFLFDIQNFSVVFSEGNEMIQTLVSDVTSVKSCIKVYKDWPDRVMNVICGPFTLRIIRYPNKQLRSEISFSNGMAVKNAYGFVAIPLSTKQCRLHKLNDIRYLNRERSSQFKKSITDTFWTSKDSKMEKRVLNIDCF